MKTFGEILKEKRTEKGLSQKKLAEKANTHFTTISYYERQKREPNLFIALNIANALDCSVYELCGMTDQELVFSKDCSKCKYENNFAHQFPCSHCCYCYTGKFEPKECEG